VEAGIGEKLISIEARVLVPALEGVVSGLGVRPVDCAGARVDIDDVEAAPARPFRERLVRDLYLRQQDLPVA